MFGKSRRLCTRRQESTNGNSRPRLNLDPVAASPRLPRNSLGGLNMSKQIPVSHMAFVRARAGRSAELGVRLSALIDPSRAAPGCLSFALQHSQCDPELWLVSGFWSNQQMMTAYFNSPAMEIFAERCRTVATVWIFNLRMSRRHGARPVQPVHKLVVEV